ncbi:MAG TPA: M28 family peptidase [Pyrinomonadaceae bacterium]|nr:M28 family peptidase [Pyrinomonadaceae bacterium]
MEGREIGTPGGVKAREYVLKRFKEAGLEPTTTGFLQPFTYKKSQGANVFGIIRGARYADKYFSITAHYDHLGIKKGSIYNGADDNASGTAAIIALATYFKKHQPDISLIFVAFDAEEAGLAGSKTFIAEPPIRRESIVANINLDMVGRNDKNELYACGTYHYPFLKSYLEKIAGAAKVKLLLGHDRPEQGSDDWTLQSDHGSFHRQNIPFIYFGVEDHKDYHKPTDDYEKLDKDFFVHGAEAVLETIKLLDSHAKDISAHRKLEK